MKQYCPAGQSTSSSIPAKLTTPKCLTVWQGVWGVKGNCKRGKTSPLHRNKIEMWVLNKNLLQSHCIARIFSILFVSLHHCSWDCMISQFISIWGEVGCGTPPSTQCSAVASACIQTLCTNLYFSKVSCFCSSKLSIRTQILEYVYAPKDFGLWRYGSFCTVRVLKLTLKSRNLTS